MTGDLLKKSHTYAEPGDAAALWATGVEFKLRRTWWRRVRFSPTVLGFQSITEAMLDLAAVIGGRTPPTLEGREHE